MVGVSSAGSHLNGAGATLRFSAGASWRPCSADSGRSLRVSRLRSKSKLLGVRLECAARRNVGGLAMRSFPVSANVVSAGRVAHAAESKKDSEGARSSVGQESDDGRFDWNSQWYPIFVAADLDKRLPHAAKILSRDLVVWWDPNGGCWQIFQDRCPHRLAPLSEGRIGEDGHLHCSYHGWAFAPSTGACSLIPQAPAERLTVKNSKRACATVYPSTVRQGLLWVWADATEGAQERADASPIPIIPELDDPDFVYQFFSADLHYGYEALTENLLDPAHIPFAHHKILGNRRQAGPYDLSVRGISKPGFIGESLLRGPVAFQAPCLVTWTPNIPLRPPIASRSGWLTKFVFGHDAPVETKVLEPRKLTSAFYCIPVAPGKSRVIVTIPRNFAKLFFHATPTWVDHQARMLILISDLYFLHIMERKIEGLRGTTGWAKAVHVPTGADGCVVAFRKWLQQFSGGAVDWGGTDGSLPRTPSKRELLDKYSMHVEKCPSCRQALSVFKVAETGLLLLSLTLLALVAASGSSPSLSGVRRFSGILTVIAAATFAISKALSWYTHRAFYFKDYIHGLVK